MGGGTHTREIDFGAINERIKKLGEVIKDRNSKKVTLSVVSEPPFQAGKPVEFKVGIEPDHSGLQYQFDFGDGIKSEWLQESAIKHIYGNLGTYNVGVVASGTIVTDQIEDISEEFTVTSNTVTVQVEEHPPPEEHLPPVEYSVFIRTESNRIEQGQAERFKAFLSPEDSDVEYVFDFGDNYNSGWTREAVVEHLYLKSGIYHVFVTARKGMDVIARSNRILFEVIPKAASPIKYKVFLSASKPPFQVGKPVEFEVETKPSYSSLQYKYYYGDGSVSRWLSRKKTSHKYSTRGTYDVLVKARGANVTDQIEGISKNFTVTSNTILVKVDELLSPNEYSLNIEASQNAIQQGQKVKFKSILIPEVSNVEYVFDFDGGNSSGWTREGEVEHLYLKTGVYQVFVTARKGIDVIARSNKIPIEVIDPNAKKSEYSVFLYAEPSSAKPGQTITFRAALKPHTEKVEYRFIFGDGKVSDWVSETSTGYVYSRQGNYHTYAMARVGQKIMLESNPIMIKISLIPTRVIWVGGIAGLLILVGGGFYLSMKISKKTDKEKRIKKHLKAKIRISPQKDIGSQRIEVKGLMQSDLEIRFRSIIDQGEQNIEADDSLIIEEGRG